MGWATAAPDISYASPGWGVEVAPQAFTVGGWFSVPAPPELLAQVATASAVAALLVSRLSAPAAGAGATSSKAVVRLTAGASSTSTATATTPHGFPYRFPFKLS